MKLALACAALVGCASAPTCTVDVETDPAACASCHAGEVASWTASRHAASFTDGDFQRELEPLRPAWCIQCHAPVETRRDLGVACAGCHAQRDARAACATCHQFNFPVLDGRGTLVRMTENRMQKTVDEASGAACTDCHDPHAPHGSHDDEMRTRALDIAVCSDGDEVRVSLANIGAAHHVPTGGVDRHIDVRIWRSSAPEHLVAFAIGRAFELVPGGGKRTVSDTSIPAGQTRTVTASLASLGGDNLEPVRVEVVYPFVGATLFTAREVRFPPCR